jgi:hypothetical protein
MRRRKFVVAVLVLCVSVLCSASNYVVPTTTLAAQVGNNTSAANNFYTQSNGNLGAANISKVNLHSLLYPGANTKVYAHFLLWFGPSNHMNVGYSSTDPDQVKRQINDMISRGIDGVIIDWYGPGNFIDQATQLVMVEAEKHSGFTFAIMVDQGALEWDSCQGCTPQQALIQQLQYVEQTYFPSPAYMRLDGAPVITNFNIDLSYSIDWNAVNTALSSHPAFLFQNNNGFTHVLSGGSYSWVMPTTTDYGMGYLSSFYHDGMSYSNDETVGAGYKGFNDTLASWGSNRIMNQQCGQTWLQTFGKINSLYNSGNQLAAVQLVTWNDYEEGTEIESGIDDCVSISASVSDNAVQWKIAGDENVLDHYTIYISEDGQNLMQLADESVGMNSLNLCSFPVPPGNYKIFVQAVGKPTLANRITGPVNYTSTCNAAAGSPTLSLAALPAEQSIAVGRSGSFTITASVTSGTFVQAIALTCPNLPAGFSCSFAPAAITPTKGGAYSTLRLSCISAPQAGVRKRAEFVYALGLFPLAGVLWIGVADRRRTVVRCMSILCIAVLGMSLCSCNGASSRPSVYPITINGSAGSVQLSTVISVSVP